MTEKKVVGATKVIELLRAVVAEKGEGFKYSNPEWTHMENNTMKCFNFHGDEPGCIVGHVLGKLGVTAEMARTVGVAGSSSACNSVWALASDDAFEWRFTPEAMNVLTEAQGHQDSGHSWGESLKVAEKYFDGIVGEQ